MRECSECGQSKPDAAFPAKSRGTRKCKACVAAYARKWRMRPENHPRLLAIAKAKYQWKRDDQIKYLRRYLLRKYGLTPESYQELFDRQQGVCAICKRPEKATIWQNGSRAIRRLAVDHDHATGKVRGLLCSRCNILLGQIESNGLIHRFLHYLQG